MGSHFRRSAKTQRHRLRWWLAALVIASGLGARLARADEQTQPDTPAEALQSGGLLREFWRDLPEVTIRTLTDSPTFPLHPDETSRLSEFEIPADMADFYGDRLRGLLVAPVTGYYTFWIASDDNGELRLSTDSNPANARRIAREVHYVTPRNWTFYPEQRSDPVYLEKGRSYYIETLHKEAWGYDNLAVAWQIPGGRRQLIASEYLRPWNGGKGGEGITYEEFANGIAPTSEGAREEPFAGRILRTVQLTEFRAPAGGEKRQGRRIRGYLHPTITGDYAFSLEGGTNGELWLSTDDSPVNKASIAQSAAAAGNSTSRTGTQTSKLITLEAGKSYYVEALDRGNGTKADGLGVGWKLPNGQAESAISAAFLTPYDSDYDGMPDWFEIRNGLDPHNPDDAWKDADDDGLSNLEEFWSRSNPKVAETFATLPPILSVQQVRKLGEASYGKKARLRGVVTYSFNSQDFYLQDGTGGIYVAGDDHLKTHFRSGEIVIVEGTVEGDMAAPSIALAGARAVGTAPLPWSRIISFEQDSSGNTEFPGAAACKRAEIEGVIRSASIEEDWFHGKNLVLTAIAPGGQFEIRCPEIGGRTIESWIDVAVQVRGVVGFNPKRQSLGLVMYVPSLLDIHIKDTPPKDPFLTSTRAVRSLLQFYRQDAGRRVKVAGTVLYSEPGKMMFLRDGTGALQVFTSQPDVPLPGDMIQALGFSTPGDDSPVLTDAVFRKEGPNVPIPAVHAQPEDIIGGKLNCELVTLQAKLVDYIYGSDKQGLWVKAGNTLFDAYWNANNGLPSSGRFEKDSTIEITGIALVQVANSTTSPQTFHLLLPSIDSVKILQEPPWWTLRRLLWTIGALVISMLLTAAWIAVLSKKKKILEEEVVLRKRAEENLQLAHQELETRMTAELHEEMDRHEQTEAELQAVLQERTRIAQELHDTLEQGLVGIGWQLDNAVEVMPDDLALARRHLESARRLVEDSQAETRRSVWDLRSQNLERGDLLSALDAVARQIFSDTGIAIEMARHGKPTQLPILVENNLFRIGQEALTNIMKHARAQCVAVSLEHGGDGTTLTVRDDGVGFDAVHPIRDGHHFGLQGIRERAKRIGAELEVKSGPDDGSQIRVHVPLVSAPSARMKSANFQPEQLA